MLRINIELVFAETLTRCGTIWIEHLDRTSQVEDHGSRIIGFLEKWSDRGRDMLDNICEIGLDENVQLIFPKK
jgi:hypothetical protein